jgi:molybdopterin converting factor subunit 1
MDASINIKYFAILRELAGCEGEALTLAPGDTAARVYMRLAERHGFRLGLNEVRVAVNDEFTGFDHPLTAGDRLVFIPPVSGG